MIGYAGGKRIANGLFWVLLALPSLVAVLQIRPGELTTLAALFDLLGRLTAIAGLSAFLLAAILAVRVPGFDRLFGGLTRLWQRHHSLGGAAFVLLLAHPLFLALAAARQSGSVELLFPVPPTAAAAAGWGALLAMMLFLAPSFAFFGEPRYQRWKRLHRVSGIALVLGLTHTFSVSRSLPRPWDYVLWGGLAVLAVTAVGYRLVFSRFSRLRYRIDSVAHPANNVAELSLSAEERPLVYRPGQFVYLRVFDEDLASGYAEEHPYTLSSAPEEPMLRLAVKDLGDSSRALREVRRASPAEIEGPYGCFFPAATGPALWIAGGIGVTPFLSQARHLAAVGREWPAVDVVMIYCAQDEARAVFIDELRRIEDRVRGFSLALHCYYREGPLSAEWLTEACPDAGRRHAWICGPAPLIALSRRHLLAAGTALEHIHTEEFRLL